MKKAVYVLIVLIIIFGGWLVSRIWVFEHNDENGDLVVQEPVDVPEATPEPEPEPEPCTEEEDRLREEELQAELAAKRELVIEESRSLFVRYFYEEAIALLNEDESLINNETQELEAEILAAMNSLVLFEGDIKHIFFRSLVINPEHIFSDPTVPARDFNEGYIFQSELLKILSQLLERGYVLYPVNSVFNRDDNGSIRRNDIYLPPGKIPLLLSLDDPSYRQNIATPNRIGFASRVVMDEYGELATEVPLPDGDVLVTYDGDVHLIVDAFVRNYPEFSYRGAKGIIGATGFMGIFGYDLDELIDEEIRQEVIAICEKFKENGWVFANHSYSHNRIGFWGPESNHNNIIWDMRMWRDIIEPITGPTNIFIAPFGFLLRGQGLQAILDNDYFIYCTIDNRQSIIMEDNHVVMGRIEIGGYNMARHATVLNENFFDVESVIDPNRPPVVSR